MKEKNVFYRFFRALFFPIFKFVFRPIIVNSEYIPKDGSAIIAGNHKHALDPILVDTCTKRTVFTLAKKELHDGMFGFFFKAVGTIPVDLKSSSNKNASNAAVNKLKEGNLINLSPEAKRNFTNELLLPFKYGAVSMAKKTGSKIIPYSITGEYKLFSKNLKIVFGKPIDVSKLEIEKANEKLYNAIKKLLQENMDMNELKTKTISKYRGVENKKEVRRNEKLKILLIHPEISRTKYNFVGIIENECLELEYISSILKEKNYDVHIYDGQVEKISVKEKIKMFNPDIVYVCGRTRQENFMLEYCMEAKKYNENIITIIGGLHAQLGYERMYKEYVDYILTTFDVFKILDIIDFKIFNKKINIESVDGICYKENNKWFKNDSKPFDINKLPLPDRTYFYDHPNNYRYLELEHAAWVRTAYCCPYRCKFCQRNRMNNGKYVYRDIEDVVNEISKIKSDNIYIVDDDFLFNEERLLKFVSLVKKKKINKKYICYGRSDFISKNEDLMSKLKDVGLYYVLVGLEAISDKSLNSYNKKSNVDNNIKSIEICHKLGINIMGMFIVDLDYKKNDFKSLYNWIKKYDLKHVAISIFTPEFGIETYDMYKDRIITDNPSHWDYLHVVCEPKYMSVRKYYFYYYTLLIKLFIKAKKDGIYDFIDYSDYIKSFVVNIFKKKRKNDDE